MRTHNLKYMFFWSNLFLKRIQHSLIMPACENGRGDFCSSSFFEWEKTWKKPNLPPSPPSEIEACRRQKQNGGTTAFRLTHFNLLWGSSLVTDKGRIINGIVLAECGKVFHAFILLAYVYKHKLTFTTFPPRLCLQWVELNATHTKHQGWHLLWLLTTNKSKRQRLKRSRLLPPKHG